MNFDKNYSKDKNYGKVFGRMATNEEIEEFRPWQNVHNGYICIKPLSKVPYAHVQRLEEPFYYCDANILDRAFANKTDEEIAWEMEGKYIVFTPCIYGYPNKKTVICHDQVYVDENNLGDKIKDYEHFTAVPCLDLDRAGIKNFETLENMLERGALIRANVGISPEYEDMPNLLMAVQWKSKREMEAYVYGDLASVIVNKDTCSFVISNAGEHKIPFQFSDSGSLFIDEADNLIFMPVELELSYYNAICRKNAGVEVEKLEEYRTKGVEREVRSSFEISNDNFSVLEDLKNSGTLKERRYLGLLDNFHAVARQAGLLYDDNDILNFDFSVRSSNLVILSGMSGTGKSKLVQTYAKAMERMGKEAYSLKMIPVSPSWTDDADILGFVDYKTMKYRPADTGLVPVLLEAAEHPEENFLICFDEMNLARVEHYFSQFISILENPEEERMLTLYSSELEKDVGNRDVYPAQIPVRNNVVFVGTVNVDESTIMLSDKVLDRANVIKLAMLPFSKMGDLFQGGIKEEELVFLSELQGIIHQEQPKLGIGYRIVRQMNDYLQLVDEERTPFTRKIALDHLLLQRVISKLRGSEEQIGRLVTEMVPALLDKYQNLSEFGKVREELGNKAQELKTYGYTI